MNKTLRKLKKSIMTSLHPVLHQLPSCPDVMAQHVVVAYQTLCKALSTPKAARPRRKTAAPAHR